MVAEVWEVVTYESMMTIFELLFSLFIAAIFNAAISASTLRTSRNCPFNFPGSSSTLLIGIRNNKLSMCNQLLKLQEDIKPPLQ